MADLQEYLTESDSLALGKYLLLAANAWTGLLKFNDERAMSRFNGYLAKLGTARDVSSKGDLGPARSGGS